MRYTAMYYLAAVMMFCASAHAANKVSFNAAGDMVINGETTFPISVALPPPPDGKTPTGKDAFAELHDGGVTLIRVPPPEKWDEAGEAMISQNLAAAVKHGMYGWVSLRGIDHLPREGMKEEQTLRDVVAKFKDNPGVIGWKGKDEPAWSKVSVEAVLRVYKVIHQADNNDLPVNVFQAPRLTWERWVPYMAGCDYTGMDIFPVGYPMGKHSNLPNKGLSLIGDETQRIMKAAGGKPVWMTLQIAWSGMSRPGRNTMRYPTFFQERYMTYEAIINGARGLNYFGGHIKTVMTDRDKELGWNWRFWDRILKPVLAEINADSPLHPALIAPNSKLPIKVEGANDVEFCVREAGKDLYIIASKREGDTVQVKFTGLPTDVSQGQVLYEPPRTVEATDGSFMDWFGPNEVHIYRFQRS
jgi:hypothetical protein